MNTYRQFIRPEYGIRQVLVEHTHFNDPLRREHIHRMLLRAAAQRSSPSSTTTTPVSDEEVRKMELASRRAEAWRWLECVDNDRNRRGGGPAGGSQDADSAHQHQRHLSWTENDPDTLVELVSGRDLGEVRARVTELMGPLQRGPAAPEPTAHAPKLASLRCARWSTAPT